MRKIGIYGGTFDPVHKGHESAAAAFCRQSGLSLLYFVPTRFPPHKPPGYADTAARLDMLRLAFDGESFAGYDIKISDIEIKRERVGYTYDTLNELRAVHPEAEFCLLIGSDMLATLESWHRFDEFCLTVDFYCAGRHADNAADARKIETLRAKYGIRIEALDFTPLPVSSSELRAALSEADDKAGIYLSEGVYKYIRENRLYSGC